MRGISIDSKKRELRSSIANITRSRINIRPHNISLKIRREYEKMSLKKLQCLLVCFGLALPVYAESPLWKITKGDNHLYIGGTIHLLGPNDYPLPPAFEKVYKNSKLLIFETDMTKAEDPEFLEKIQVAMRYSDGSKLKQHLKPSTYKALEEYLKPLGIPIVAFEDFKPAMVSMTLSVMELQKLGVNGAGVDLFYNSKAIDDHKMIGKLETLEQQLQFMQKMGEGDPDEFILYTLREIKDMAAIFGGMKKAWRKGDMKKLAEIGITPLKEFPDTYKMILVDRNKAWVPKIEAMLKTKDIEMILVGALHLAGKDSVLNQLKGLGYKIEQF